MQWGWDGSAPDTYRWPPVLVNYQDRPGAVCLSLLLWALVQLPGFSSDKTWLWWKTKMFYSLNPRCPNWEDPFLSCPSQLPQARRGQHLYRRPQNGAACCKMKANFLTTSLTLLLLLCYAPLPIHSHGVHLLTVSFPDLAAQTIVFLSIPWWDLLSLSFIQGCRV